MKRNHRESHSIPRLVRARRHHCEVGKGENSYQNLVTVVFDGGCLHKLWPLVQGGFQPTGNSQRGSQDK